MQLHNRLPEQACEDTINDELAAEHISSKTA
jgi:hypothetical protein